MFGSLLFVAACSGGGGGGGPAQLQPGVTLTATWNLTTLITAVDGVCSGVAVGQSQVGAVTIDQAGNLLTLDFGSGDPLTATLNGLAATFTQNQTFGTTVLTSQFTLNFTADGQAFTGAGTITSVTPNGTCTATTSATASRVTTVTLDPDSPFAADGAMVTFHDGAVPEFGGMAVATTKSADDRWLGITAAVPFDAIALVVGEPGAAGGAASGYWLLEFAEPRSEALVECPEGAVAVVAVHARSRDGFGPPVRIDVR